MSVRSFGISEGNIIGGEKKENPQIMCLIVNTCREAAHVMVSASKWGLGSEAWAASLVFRVRVVLECPEDNLRELM